MITRMTKYDIVVYHRDGEEFLARLQELGLVDVTVSGWEPGDEERALMTEIEKRRAAILKLEGVTHGKQASDTPWEDYLASTAHLGELDARIAVLEHEADEVRPWGDFDAVKLSEIERAGVGLRYYSLDDVFFATIGELPEGAREVAPPAASAKALEGEIGELKLEREGWQKILESVAAGAAQLKKETDRLADGLDLRKVADAAQKPVEGMLLVLEGWATRETSTEVDEFLDASGVYYQRSLPTPQDDVPVVLRNKKWSSPFEIIGDLYALPKYGTMDLTAFFGPFYMVFFGFCLGDAGYGLMFLLIGLVMRNIARRKGSKMLGQAANLTLLCGGSAVVVGFLIGGFFGIQLVEVPMLAGVREVFLSPDVLFPLSLGLGVVQILFAMVLRIVNLTKQFGFRYALGALGWIMVVCGIVYVALPNMRAWMPAVTISYHVNMHLFLAVAAVGGVLMLFFNTPKKNIFVNFGSGLWNTYNDVTGLLGDLLSYVRLFALCLSGGTLALVFNKLVAGMPVVFMILVLLIGHGINIFMSALGSLVHPMRLTFVEFYKNAGFESAGRKFEPLARGGSGRN